MNNYFPFKLQPLNLDYSDLEPCISKKTLLFHHDKHLLSYTNNLNEALKINPKLQDLPLKSILSNLNNLNTKNKVDIINNGGGVFNHNFYFEALTKPNTKKISKELQIKLEENFGSVNNFIENFKNLALTFFGSGWIWLVLDKDNSLKIVPTSNQDTPLKNDLKPLLNIDVWEHAYYLDYQNLRKEYIDNFFKIINWDIVKERL